MPYVSDPLSLGNKFLGEESNSALERLKKKKKGFQINLPLLTGY